MKVVSAVLGYVLAVLVVLVIGAAAHAIVNQGDLAALGAEFPVADRAGWIAHDIVGMAPLYAPIMGAGLLVAFLAAGFVSRLAEPLRPIVFMVAGAVAVVAAILIMGMVFGITPIASTRDPMGLGAQALAGALAGLSFVLVKRTA